MTMTSTNETTNENGYENPVRCTACGETCEYEDAKHDQGYVYCPACVAADPDLQ